MMRLVLVSMARAGTNWLQDIVGNASNTQVRREILGPRWREMIAASPAAERILASRSLPLPGPEEDPLGIIELWEEVAREGDHCGISFTLFPHHARGERLQRILARPNSYAVHLMRRQLPRYLSYRKAREAGAWSGLATDALKPVLEVEDFLREGHHVARWHNRARKVPGVRQRVLRYEQDLDGGTQQALEALRLAVPWLDLPASADAVSTVTTRQDSRAPLFERFANGSEFDAALRACGMREAAERYPDDAVWAAS